MISDSADLWKTQSDLLHRQLAHILLIRGWAASLTAGLVTVIVTSRVAAIAYATPVLIAFWYTEHVYGEFLEDYVARETALRLWLAKNVQDPSAREAMERPSTYRRGLPRFVSYLTMLLVLVGTALVVHYAP